MYYRRGVQNEKKSPKFPFPSLCNPLNDISENLRSKIKHVSHADPCAQSRDCIGLPQFHLHCGMRIAKKKLLHLALKSYYIYGESDLLHLALKSCCICGESFVTFSVGFCYMCG